MFSYKIVLISVHKGLEIITCIIWHILSNIYNMSAVLYQIYQHEPKASGCISDTTRTRMMYIAYDTPTSKCSCLSTILKIKAILAK